MPVSWNPLSLFRRRMAVAETLPSLTPLSPSGPSAIGAAGLFETGALRRDAHLDQLRATTAPTTLQDLKSNDPRDQRVVYKQVSGRPVRLNHGSIIEGSVDFGGLQPNYVIDLTHPRLKRLLGDARALQDKPFADRCAGVVALVQRTLTEGAYDAPAYLKLLAEHRDDRVNITLGDYLATGAGVCRENALLTHLALLEAGVDSEYLYCAATQSGRAEDHAVALAVDDKGRKVVVDSYNRNFHGFLLDDLLKPGGSTPRDKRLPSSSSSSSSSSPAPSMFGCTLSITAHPVYWVPVRALRAPILPPMPPIDELRDFRVVRPARR